MPHQNPGMMRYSLRAVALFFCVLSMTACATNSWQAVSLDAISPAQLIEEDRPSSVRVTTSEVTELEVVAPRIEGDELVAARPFGFSVPLADILRLEVEGTDLGPTVLKTLGLGAGVVVLGTLAAVGVLFILVVGDELSNPTGSDGLLKRFCSGDFCFGNQQESQPQSP